jgi:hypothetical protein
MELTTEQQFRLCCLKAKVEGMSREQAISELVATFQQMQEMDAHYKTLIKQQWGL